jgi:hypothetical protein
MRPELTGLDVAVRQLTPFISANFAVNTIESYRVTYGVNGPQIKTPNRCRLGVRWPMLQLLFLLRV